MDFLTIGVFLVVGIITVRLLYKLGLGFLNMQRKKGVEKYIDEDNFEKYKNRLYFILLCATFFIIFVVSSHLDAWDQAKLILIRVALGCGIVGAAILKLRIPYIEREFRKGNPKYADEYRVAKITKILKIIGTSLVIATIIVLFVLRLMRWKVF